MKAKDQADFLALMVQIGALYKQPMPELLMELYWVALQRFELSAIRQAIQAHVNHPDTGQYMPKPADVVRYLEGSYRTRALCAWGKVLQAIQGVGAYSSVVFDDPLIHVVITEMGGWTRLCQVLFKELPFREHAFVACYQRYLDHPPVKHLRQLNGLLPQRQDSSQPWLAHVVCIGDVQKAQQVYAQGKADYRSHPSR